MDVKGYFRKVRELESSIADRFVIVVSQTTVDGGKEGIISEVPKFVGCQLVVEGRARIASPEETESYRAEQRAAYEEFERLRDGDRGTWVRASREAKTPKAGKN